MPLTMKDITNACAALNRFKYEAGPYGVTSPPPGAKGFSRHDFVRIEPLSGIASPGRWRIKQLPGGEPISGVISNKRQLRTALLEWLAEREYGPRPPARAGYTIYAHDNGVRTSMGMANAIVWSYRKTRAPKRALCGVGMKHSYPVVTLSVDCPRCGVSPGEPCQATHPKHGLLWRPNIKKPHRERVEEARRVTTG